MRTGLKILIYSSFVYNIAAGSFAPLYAIFVEKIGGGVLEASGIWSVQQVIVGILVFLFGKIEDKLNKRHMLILGYTLHAIGFIAYNFVSNIWHLLAIQSFIGIAAAVNIPAFDAFYSRQVSRGKESSEWGTWESGTRIISAIAAIVGGIIVSKFSFRYLFIFMSAFSLLSVFIVWHLLRKEEYKKLFHQNR